MSDTPVTYGPGTYCGHPQRAQHDFDWQRWQDWRKSDFRQYLCQRYHPAAWHVRAEVHERRQRVLARREDWYWIMSGDPVTWVGSYGNLCTGRVVNTPLHTAVFTVRNDGEGYVGLRCADEHRYWIRGHHATGELADALLATAALLREAA